MLRADHPDAQVPLSLDRFCALEHILVSYEGESFWGVTDDALAKVGRKRRVGLSVSSFLVLPEVLVVSDMIAVVPSRLARARVNLRAGAAGGDSRFLPKSMAWHERNHRDPAQQWLLARTAA